MSHLIYLTGLQKDLAHRRAWVEEYMNDTNLPKSVREHLRRAWGELMHAENNLRLDIKKVEQT